MTVLDHLDSHRLLATDVEAALSAMSADELRDFAREALARVGGAERRQLADLVLLRAARSQSGPHPSPPAPGLVREVTGFVAAAQDDGDADPEEVDHYLREGTRAFLAREYAVARAVFAALVPAISSGEVYLGQDELVDEVLTVDLHASGSQHLVAVYMTTAPVDRVQALLDAIEQTDEVTLVREPLHLMEEAAVEPLPEFGEFVSAWIARLEDEPSDSNDEWESDREKWLREAVSRRDGIDGLGRLARACERPQALHAWCRALVEAKDWSGALDAYAVRTRVSPLSSERSQQPSARLAAQMARRRKREPPLPRRRRFT